MNNTPKIGVNGVVWNEEDLLLFEKRESDGTIGLPGGWVDWGESPEEAIVREYKEETGFDVVVERLIRIYTRRPGDFDTEMSSVHVLYACRIVGGCLEKSEESLDIFWGNAEDMTDWHKDHGMMVRDARIFFKDALLPGEDRKD